jgi:hypothetical protein
VGLIDGIVILGVTGFVQDMWWVSVFGGEVVDSANNAEHIVRHDSLNNN